MGCMESDNDEFLITNHVTLLFDLILPKRSRTKKITFGNKYYGVMKQKLSWRFGARGFLHKQHSANIKSWKRLDDVFELFHLQADWIINWNNRNNEIWRLYQNSGCKSITISAKSWSRSAINFPASYWSQTYVLICTLVASEKQDYSSAMVFNESWLEFYWKSMARIEYSKKLSVPPKLSGIRTCNHWRTEENPRKDLFKSHQKL